MPRLELDVSGAVFHELAARRKATGQSLDRLVDDLLAEALELRRHSLFQVSTSNALVKGVFEGNTTVAELRARGDFGLGTFDRLDGEMIMVDGRCYRATYGGLVSEVDDDREVPFALVTRFSGDAAGTVDSQVNLAELASLLDDLRPSQNLFVAIGVEGRFDEISLRAACRALPGEGLVEATEHQSEFQASGRSGSLVGFWVPEYAATVSVPGYHFHFISDDRSLGGHVLDLRASGLRLALHTETDLHLSLPETEEFLAADLRGDFIAELETAETGGRND